MSKFNLMKCIYILAIAAMFSLPGYAQQKPDAPCPMMDKPADKNHSSDEAASTGKDAAPSDDALHHDMVMENGTKEMGFSQTATTHHFLIMKDGGAIQVEANDSTDIVNRDKIRKHLSEIAREFKNGIFTTPFAVHGKVPPGVPEMDMRKKNIHYMYEETDRGARVRIMTGDAGALAAIHAFLKFQIEEHQTGDPIPGE